MALPVACEAAWWTVSTVCDHGNDSSLEPPHGVPLYKALDQAVCHCLQPNHLLSDGTMPVLADCMHVFCIYEERLSVEVLADLTFRDNKPLTLCRADYNLTTHIPAWHFACQEQRHHLHRAQ